MDTSIRLYNTNSGLHSVRDTERNHRSPAPLRMDENSCVEMARGNSATPDTNPQLSIPTGEEQVQKVEVTDFEQIFLRYQGPITNSSYWEPRTGV